MRNAACDTLEMRVAGFREKLDAVAAALILRDNGYDVELVGVEGERSLSLTDLPEAVARAHWARALLVSNCEGEYFQHVVVENFGSVLWQHRPGRYIA